MQKLKLFFICYMLCISFQSRAQEDILDYFTGLESNGKVYLNWVISQGSTCNGIIIKRSTDGINFKEIGNIPGLCGSSSTPVGYDFTDPFPVKNSINYYQLHFGNIGISEIIKIEYIDVPNIGYQMRPNPLKSLGKLYFNNENGSEHTLFLYSSSGMKVIMEKTREDHFNLDATALNPGIYFFYILKNESITLLKGQILVVSN